MPADTPPTQSNIPAMAIGSDTWPGGAKILEEAGELIQVLGKLAAYPNNGTHPDGTDLTELLHEEIADLEAALVYFRQANGLNERFIVDRREMKIHRFMRWDRGERSRA